MKLTILLAITSITAILLVALIGTFLFSKYKSDEHLCKHGYSPSDGHCDECGKTFSKPNVRIVGGLPAVQHSWPSQVLLTQSYSRSFDYGSRFGIRNESRNSLCAGVIINRYTILSAAHCFVTKFSQTIENDTFTIPIEVNEKYPTIESMFSIYIAASNISFLRNGIPPPLPTYKVTVKKIIIHEEYESVNRLNDIALFILSEPIELNHLAQPACLPNPSNGQYPPSNTTVFASGWGVLDEDATRPNVLYNVKLTNYEAKYCDNVVSREKDFERELCAGDYAGGKDTCWGDSGGGLFVYDQKSDKYIVAGITSFGDGCARPGKPGIYTRVSFYYDWIIKNWITSNEQDKNTP